MRKLAILAVIFAGVTPAKAFESFLPTGMGYSSSNAQLSQLSAQDRSIISQTDIYETDIYQRQLRARQLDARMRAFSNDRNSDGILPPINY
jgi:serine/threonine protein kinase HipA of HipAB toxin-antitoxin module